MLATIRPHSWDLPLYLHVLGAMVLFGATGAVALLAWAGGRGVHRAALARGALGTLLLCALPAWVLLFVFGSVTKSKEHLPSSGVNWVDVPVTIAGAGLVVLLVASGAAFAWSRRPDGRWQPRTVGLLSAAYLVALAAAWWIMTAKPTL
jgi:hypothetical protein